MDSWYKASSGNRIQRRRQLCEWKALQTDQLKNAYTATEAYKVSAAIAGGIVAQETIGCCEVVPPTPEDLYYVVTSTPTVRSSAGFDISANEPFTIEWYQTLTNGTFPRVFSIGSYADSSGITFAVSLEGVFYVWLNGSPFGAYDYGDITNQQFHFAVVRDASNNVTVYKNGESIGSFVYSSAVPVSSADLTIRNESSPTCEAQFYGDIPSFRWVTGDALYTSSFTPPSMPLVNVSGTVLLINDFPTSGPAVFNGFTVTPNSSVPYSECGGGEG